MNFNATKFFFGAAVAISLGTFAIPVGSPANTLQERLFQSEGPVQIAQADTTVKEKSEKKTTQSTDSYGMPQTEKNVEHETVEKSDDSNGATEETRHKAEVNESTNAMGDTTKQTHETTESSEHN